LNYVEVIKNLGSLEWPEELYELLNDVPDPEER